MSDASSSAHFLQASHYFAYCGVHYTTCPVEVREVFARRFEQDGNGKQLASIFAKHGARFEFVPISTCNRFDVCIAGSVERNVLEAAISEFTGICNASKYMRFAADEDAIRMLFRIACSLDSLVLGEPHILGQLKESFSTAHRNELCGPDMTAIFNRCFQVAKRVRTETPLGQRGVSIGHASVEVAKRVYNDLTHCGILVVGAGEMARIAAQHFSECGAQNITIANRTFERGLKLATSIPGAKAIEMDELGREFSQFDIIVTATASQTYILTPSDVKNFLKRRGGKITAMIDISVPRNIDPRLGELENVFLFDIDDLDKVMNENREARHQAAFEAEKIIDDEVVQFASLRKQRENLLYVGKFHAWTRALIERELRRSLRSTPLEQKLDVIADAVAKRLVTPVAALAKADVRMETETSVGQALEQLFALSTKVTDENNET